MGIRAGAWMIVAVACLLSASLALCGQNMAASEPSSGPSAETANDQAIFIANLQDAYEGTSLDLGLSDDEIAKVTAVENQTIDDVRAGKLAVDAQDQDASMDAALGKMRDCLTAKHQQAFDAGMTQHRLLNVYAAIPNQMPPDLGALAKNGSLRPEDFLVYGSSKTAPAGLEKEPDQFKDWINANSDFVYLGAGKELAYVPNGFVVLYIKPELAPDGNVFFRIGAPLGQLDKGASALVIADLQAGRNPPPSWPAAASEPSTRPVEQDEFVAGMNGVFTQIWLTLGLSINEGARVQALMQKATDEVRSGKLPVSTEDDRDASEEAILQELRACLTPQHQQAFDALMKRGAEAITERNLRRISKGIKIYEAQFGGKIPADLGALAAQGEISPRSFLADGSSKAAPAKLDLDPDKFAAWVNANTDFVFLGGGKNVNDLPQGFVMAYIDPKAAPENNQFVLADGSVHALDKDASAKVIADLQGGKNPPPSWPGGQ